MAPIEFPTLPENYRPATINDFHIVGQVRIGRPFIIKGSENKNYELYTASSNLKASEIKPFIDLGKCWVKDE
jgi:hypothetical protein